MRLISRCSHSDLAGVWLRRRELNVLWLVIHFCTAIMGLSGFDALENWPEQVTSPAAAPMDRTLSSRNQTLPPELLCVVHRSSSCQQRRFDLLPSGGAEKNAGHPTMSTLQRPTMSALEDVHTLHCRRSANAARVTFFRRYSTSFFYCLPVQKYVLSDHTQTCLTENCYWA